VPGVSVRHGALSIVALTALVSIAAPAAAQLPAPGRPGPYVIDLRAATFGLPSSEAFYPVAAGDEETLVASRGFGFDVGGHVYVLNIGPTRLGLGASFLQVHGTALDTSARLRLLAPQISFNFGSADGWSYLGGGVGTARIRTELDGSAPQSAESDSLRTLNVGGGARWFMNRHVAVGFDVRLHRLASNGGSETRSPTPSSLLFGASVGLSVR
jgi:opacity protein-like surface antigen